MSEETTNKPTWVSVCGSTVGDLSLPNVAVGSLFATARSAAAVFKLVDGAIGVIMRMPTAATSGFVLGAWSNRKAFSFLILALSMNAPWFANVYLVVFVTIVNYSDINNDERGRSSIPRCTSVPK